MGRHLLSVTALVLSLWLTACGGGGGGGNSGPQISINPNPLTTTYASGAIAPQLSVDVTLHGLPSSFYVYLIEDAPVLSLDNLSIYENGNNNYTCFMSPLCTLAAGEYRGHFTIIISSDPYGQNAYASTTLPYDFLVTEGSLVTATVDGIQLPTPASFCTPLNQDITDQTHVITLTSSVPVTWDSSISTSSGMPTLSNVSTTATTWTGTVGEATTSQYFYSGAVQVNATPIGAYSNITCMFYLRANASPLRGNPAPALAFAPPKANILCGSVKAGRLKP